MNDTLQTVLAIFGIFCIGFFIFTIGYTKGAEYKIEEKEKINIEQRISNLEKMIKDGYEH